MDPISNFLNKIKMASRGKADSFAFPSSKLILSIAAVLEKSGYIDFSKKGKKGHTIEVRLKDKKKAISVKRISKLSCRTYIKSRDIHPVRSGFGANVISTPKGVMSGAEAKKANVGGEVLFEVWQ